MTTTLQRSTASELYGMPHDGFRHELVKGELRKMSPSGWEHGVVVVNVTLLLGQHVKTNSLGVCVGAETGFKTASDPDTVRAPDLAFVGRERIPEGDAPKCRSVTVYRSMAGVTRLSEDNELDGDEVVSGFRCKVSEIFA